MVRVFLIIYVPIVLALVPLVYFSNGIIIEEAQQNLMNDMEDKWTLLASMHWPLEISTDTHQQVRHISHETGLRITLIQRDGTVLEDSLVALEDVTAIPSHAHRPEVVNALAQGDWHTTRYSTTVNMDMLYYARMLDNERILRISYPTAYVDDLRQSITQRLFVLLIFLFALIAIISAYLARRISQPIQRLSYIAEAVESGRDSIHFPDFRDPTLAKISQLMERIFRAMTQKQQLLQDEQEKLESIFTVLEEGIILVDHEHTILHYNPKAEHLLGVALEIGSNLLRDSNDFEVITFLSQILDSGENALWEKRIFRERVFEINLRILPQEKLIVLFDVTEEDRYERYKTELVSNISHELRTPLTMILGYAETLLSDPDIPEEQRQKFIRVIFKSAHSLSNLIEDVLELNRLEQTGRTFELAEPLPLQDMLTTLQERFATVTDKRIHYHIRHEQSVWCSYEHILSICTNLIDNAIKYSRGQNITVTIQRERDEQVQIVVEDEGPAIPAKERERIFERFYTVSQSRNRNRSGTGVGLSIVKHIVQAYRGTITVSESAAGGNVFSIVLYEKRPTNKCLA
ncbi:sensor histidine kinase [Desulfurispira natronophila]|nr:ATP-binding protein [Desulfurispira natronophila]